ncbi:PREDICTED: free fatty acid receptor 2-like [Chlamydotis macqueenii]|uniref:free fatty acid receptor 2-like n=1 Tax=Chlamydotis macqueenii TaxID=187382 RepID=UPI000529E57B|nr:PREDICTED: free fatty acid receptor 2-like [Chlamydotis macqueenii]
MLVLTVYILTFTVGFPANVFTFATLLGKARRRVSPSDILLLNLTAADLLLLLFLPFKMAEAAAGMTWPLPAVLCPLANFCFYSSIYLSSLFLAALSVERYLGVVFPHHYKDWRRPGRAMAASVVLWLLACSHCSIVFVAQYHGGGGHPEVNGSMAEGDGFDLNGLAISVSKTTVDVQEISSPTSIFRSTTVRGSSAPGVHHGSNATDAYKCYHDFSKDQLSFVLPLRLELFLVLFLLPFAVTVFCYVNFVRALLARPNIPLEKKQRAVGLAMATMVNFGVCFAPYNISHVVGFVEKRSPDWRVYALLLTSLNAALDPLIFYFSSTAVQRAVAGVGTAAGDKLRAAVGWCSPRSPQNESQGSLT